MNQQRPEPKDWGGGFEDVREIERRERQHHRDEVERLDLAIALCDGILALESASGYRAFVNTLEDMLKFRTTELLSARDDRSAAVLQGRCQELRSILSLMASNRENRQALAKARSDEEDRFHELERHFKPQPKPNPETT